MFFIRQHFQTSEFHHAASGSRYISFFRELAAYLRRAYKYLSKNFLYLPGKKPGFFSWNNPPPVKEKAGFLRGSQKKRYIKNFCTGTYASPVRWE
ncbi:Uncharacterized protein dnm_051400 [Desulfonema magnum]|uniref:Uncharacterized protein n=1 Tax=Desulfonema magnum TaxID=45655 RepID=A0A975BP26_9BACT|nr:Uncharacterized protein dnm_051400 [Desulfonema magnum]